MCHFSIFFILCSFLQEGVGDEQIFSGLYAYQCLDRKWVCLRPDYTKKELLTYPDQMKPRMAHTMVLCHVSTCNVSLSFK